MEFRLLFLRFKIVLQVVPDLVYTLHLLTLRVVFRHHVPETPVSLMHSIVKRSLLAVIEGFKVHVNQICQNHFCKLVQRNLCLNLLNLLLKEHPGLINQGLGLELTFYIEHSEVK